MSIIWNDIKSILYTWAFTNSGITVLWREQNAPQPSTPYITLKIIAGPRQVGDDDLRYNSDIDKHFTAGIREFTLSIQSFGRETLQTMNSLLNSIQNPVVRQLFNKNGIGIHNDPAITDVTLLLKTAFEQRYSMDLILSTAENVIIEDLTSIEHAEIEGILNDGVTEQNIEIII